MSNRVIVGSITQMLVFVLAFSFSQTVQGQSPYIPPDLYSETPGALYTFYENQGQLLKTDGTPADEVLYYNLQGNPGIYVTEEARIANVAVEETSTDPYTLTYSRVDMYFKCLTGFAPCDVTPRPLEETDDHLNFYLGHIPEGRTHVKGYSRVLFESIYPGIDAHLYSNAASPKTYLVCKPGSNPANILMKFEGHDQLSIDAFGNLEMILGTQELVIPQAVAYEVDGNNQITPLSWTPIFLNPGNGEVSFQLGSYNPANTLVILMAQPYQQQSSAPLPAQWSTEFGGNITDNTTDVVTDHAG
ncbi:MAG: hypothetical protein AAGB22_08030, partial [Bacteroidota bacterium]